jgi:hypothetical protein
MDAVGYNQVMPALQALNAIATYDGRKDPDASLSCIQAIAGLYNWSEELCLKIARVRLTGPAWNWAQARQFPSWAAFQQQLESRYGETKESAIARLECCRQYASESVKDFADRYLYNAEKAGRVEDEALIYNFIQRLQPGLKLEVARQRCHSIEEIVTFCNFWNGLLQGAEENTDPTGSAEFAPFSRPHAFAGLARRPEFKPNNQSRRPPPYRPPPLHDNTNCGPSGASRNDYRPPLKPGHCSPAATTDPSDAAIKELTTDFARLELQFLHHMEDQDQEIRALRSALNKQREQHPTRSESQYNTISPLYDDVVCDPVASDGDNDIDYELLASLLGMSSTDAELQYTPAEHTTLIPTVVTKPDYQPQEELFTRQPAPSLTESSTCMVTAGVNGMEVDSVVDTSTATSTITLDCLRRLNLDSLINPSAVNCMNADGCVTAGMGKVPNLVLSLGDFSTLISPTVTTSLDYDMLIGNDVLHRARAVIDYNRGKMVLQVEPTLAQELDISLTADFPCHTVDTIDPRVTPTPQQEPSNETHLLPTTPAHFSSSCAATTGYPSVGEDLEYSAPCADLWNSTIDHSDMDPERPSTNRSTATAANTVTAHQDSLQPHAAAHMDDTMVACQYLSLDHVSTTSSTNAEAIESLGPLSAADQTGFMGIFLEGYINNDSQAVTELDTVFLDTTMDTWDATHTAASSLPTLLTLGLTSSDTAAILSLHNASSATAAQAEAAADSLDYSGTATMCLLPQDNANKCPEAVTIFDPGGCLLPAPWRAVCRPQPH